MSNTITVTIYGDRTEHSVKFPSRWIVCPHCNGAAKTSSYLGPFTASEWAELDEDFQENYLAGSYDRPCEQCKGRSTVQSIDEEHLTRWQRKLFDEYVRQRRDFAEIDAIQAAERRMGA